MFKKQKIKSKSGITLVALVVTIVVLLILAGVSLSLVIGNDGIMKRAKEAQERYRQASENEQKDLDTVEDYMNKMTGEGSGAETGTAVKVNVGESATGVATINGKAGNTNNPTIPKGYTPINAGKATWGDGTSSPAQSSIDNGLVIKDDNNNEWVWVPVEEISKYCESVDSGVAISGSTVTTKKYTKSSIKIGREEDKTTITRGLPNSDSCREPALIDTTRDSDVNAKKAGFTDAKDMATKMVREYETMIKSIEKYGGFYIGRYELSGTVDNPTEKTGTTITDTDWYELYNACKKIGGSDKEGIATRMIWGCQWDATCDFISKKGEQKSITDSRKWGNYPDSTDPANTGNYEQYTDGYAIKKNTGSNEAWKANNIYDIAGNCCEWTQEAVDTNSRVYRGGNHLNDGSASSHSNDGPTGGNDGKRFSSHFNNYYWNLERGNQWKEEWNRLTEKEPKEGESL